MAMTCLAMTSYPTRFSTISSRTAGFASGSSSPGRRGKATMWCWRWSDRVVINTAATLRPPSWTANRAVRSLARWFGPTELIDCRQHSIVAGRPWWSFGHVSTFAKHARWMLYTSSGHHHARNTHVLVTQT